VAADVAAPAAVAAAAGRLQFMTQSFYFDLLQRFRLLPIQNFGQPTFLGGLYYKPFYSSNVQHCNKLVGNFSIHSAEH
jgi:hypothetical protein